jgi:phenylalanine-4-hydroxylase
MEQNYNAYTSEDKLVWKTLFERQVKNLQGKAADVYYEALETIGFTANKIPDFKEVDKILATHTRWKLHVVPKIVPEKDFFDLLMKKEFPATTWLRKMKQLDYLEEPDMFHDVFGHTPLLTNNDYVSFFKGVAQLALENADNEEVIKALGRIYWFTIEFGLINENNTVRIYGAGIISSFGETNHCLSDKANHFAFDVKTIMHKHFVNSEIQTDYFVIDSFKQLYESLGEIKEEIKLITERTQKLASY